TTPTDKTQATQAIHLAYHLAGHPPPAQIIWQPNPVAALIWLVNHTLSPPTPFLTDTIATTPLLTTHQNLTTLLPDALHQQIQQALTLRLHIFPARPNSPLGLIHHRLAHDASTHFYYKHKPTIHQLLNAGLHGHLNPQTLPLLDYCHHTLNLPLAPPITPLIQTTHHLGWWWPTPHYCLATPRPTTLALDDQGRLHNRHGPALAYDGWAFCAWHGAAIPDWYILQPDKITTNTINHTHNTEIRRLLLDQYGLHRYLQDTHAKLIHQDQYGQLYRQIRHSRDIFHLLLVTNSTPEPDGTHKQYLLRVPPTITTAHAAVAWTAGLPPDQYHIHAES
ncbi:MAG TPA: hypothetical protein VLL52_15475, partial [Anaerolineae bacterium]|nr:hypothetical protein [Anaerolineae bacterium]